METSNNKVMRYSDEELQEFKAIILEKLAKAKENLETLTEAFANNASEASDTAPTFKVLEEGANIRSKEENANLAARQQKFIKDFGCNTEGDFLITENLTKNGFYLPSASSLKKEQIEYICGIIREFKK